MNCFKCGERFTPLRRESRCQPCAKAANPRAFVTGALDPKPTVHKSTFDQRTNDILDG